MFLCSSLSSEDVLDDILCVYLNFPQTWTWEVCLYNQHLACNTSMHTVLHVSDIYLTVVTCQWELSIIVFSIFCHELFINNYSSKCVFPFVCHYHLTLFPIVIFLSQASELVPHLHLFITGTTDCFPIIISLSQTSPAIFHYHFFITGKSWPTCTSWPCVQPPNSQTGNDTSATVFSQAGTHVDCVTRSCPDICQVCSISHVHLLCVHLLCVHFLIMQIFLASGSCLTVAAVELLGMRWCLI